MSYSVIAITREFGSGGRTIGKKLAEELGYEFYDYDLVQKIAKESGFAESFIEEYGEDASSGGLFSFMSNWGSNISDQLYIAQRKIIIELAEKGNCVIVGRCADYILRDRDDVLNVFVHANMEYKKKRIVELYGETAESPEKRIIDKDKRRKAYYRYFTDRAWGEAKYYHICLDTSLLGLEKSTEIIKNLVKE
ncbi:MAG: cytidylate kinase-like family protein [Holdemanella sp.]|nr:cytidylate kinase-like family protein [Holdemanella sp.]